MPEEDLKKIEDYSYTMSTISSATEQDTGIGNLIYKLVQAYKNQQTELETNNQRLIEKLEKDIVNITKTLQDGKHCDDYSRCRLKAYRTKTKEILEILKGEINV